MTSFVAYYTFMTSLKIEIENARDWLFYLRDELMVIINTGLAQSYVFVSQQVYVSRPLKPAIRLVHSSRTYLDQQPYVLFNRTSRQKPY